MALTSWRHAKTKSQEEVRKESHRFSRHRSLCRRSRNRRTAQAKEAKIDDLTSRFAHLVQLTKLAHRQLPHIVVLLCVICYI